MTQLTDEDGIPLLRAPNGDLVPDTDPQALHEARCAEGWIGHEDAPAPCPVCRPHLTGPHAKAARAMSERQLQNQVRELCTRLGLVVEHVEDSRRGRTWCAGWPDLVIVGNRVIYRELKREGGALSAEQRTVGAALERAGADWAVWRPRHLLDGTIIATLTALRGPQRHARGTGPYPTSDYHRRAFSTGTGAPPRRAARIIIPD